MKVVQICSKSVKVNNPNLIIFASGFSSQTLNTKERKETIKTLANYE